MKQTLDFSREFVLEINEDNRCVLGELKPETIFSFPNGIPAFEDIKQYVFLTNENVRPFMFMQALNTSNLSFVCIDSFMICPGYEVQIPESVVEFIKFDQPEDALILSFVTLKPEIEDITANLMSPIVINTKNLLGQQIIPEQSRFPVRYKIWESIEERSSVLKVG